MRDEPGDVLGLELQIGRIKNENVAARVQIAGAQRFGDAALRTMAHGTQKRVLRHERLQQRPTLVARAVIDDDDFISLSLYGEGLSAQLQKEREIAGFILRRDEDTDIDDSGWRGSGLARRNGAGNRSGHRSSRVRRACACAPAARRVGRDTWRPSDVRSGRRSAGGFPRSPDR